ncbi:MAG TPA: dienelactone hydrolase family protein [Polyangiales bacterium]|nr:dienelactone hydrolase family protein [Polyangiales bacterium]
MSLRCGAFAFLIVAAACGADTEAPAMNPIGTTAGSSAGGVGANAAGSSGALAGTPGGTVGAAGSRSGAAGATTPVAGTGPTNPPSAAGTGSPAAGSGGPAAAGSGGATAGSGTAMPSSGAPAMPMAGTGSMLPPGSTLPPVDDYSKNGPFTAQTINSTGPDGMYTMIRPTNLGENGFKHPIATWGNGITTTPSLYPGLLDAFASHGFVVIASNNSNVTAALMTAGLDWLIKQNDSGDMAGKLDVKRAVTIGYSLGGGAAVDTASHPNVIATVSFHGLQGAAERANGPVFLMTSTADGFVTKEGYVMPCYNRSSKQPTVMATLKVDETPSFAGHLYPLGDAGDERAPAIAWLRLWVYGDQGAKKYFYGDDCLLCTGSWTDIQRKNGDWK